MKLRQHEYMNSAFFKNGLSIPGRDLVEIMREVHSKGMPLRFSAGGASMTPFIRDGDIISVSPISSRLPRVGDVVAFLNPETGLLCVHRVLSRTNGALMTQGDNLPEKPDGMIPIQAVVGRVTRVERSGRRIRLGLGPERVLLAFLCRYGLLAAIRRFAGPLYGYFRRRRILCERN